jgi:SAM-dependent methyltransferase
MNESRRPAGWSGTAYARHSAHHRALDDWFLARHRPGSADVVLDLGCGSGEFSALLAGLVPDGRVIGVDRDPSMIEAARRHAAPNLEFVQAAAEDVDGVVADSSVDLAVSRAMLHWLPLPRYPRCFEAVFRVLRPGGWFHSESAGAGNVAGVTRLLGEVAARHGLAPPPPFPDPGTVFDLVVAAGFEIPEDGVRSVAQRRPFTRDQLVALLRTQAANALTRQVGDGAAGPIVDAVVAEADRLRGHDGSYDQTFVRLEILARRPGQRTGDAVAG